MHLIATGHCICQLDLEPLEVTADILVSWRMTHDLSVLTFVQSDGKITLIKLNDFASAFPTSVKLLNAKGQEEEFSMEYLSATLAHYREQLRKQQENMENLSSASLPKPKPLSKKKDSSKKKKGQTQLLQEEEALAKLKSASKYQRSIVFNEKDWKEYEITAAESSDDVMVLALRERHKEDGSLRRTCIAYGIFSAEKVYFFP